MFVITCKKRSHDVASYMEMGSEIERYAFMAADRFRRIDKHNNKIRQILFVDETLVKIDGLELILAMGRSLTNLT